MARPLIAAAADRLIWGSDYAERLDLVFNLFPRLKERQRQQAGTLSGVGWAVFALVTYRIEVASRRERRSLIAMG